MRQTWGCSGSHRGPHPRGARARVQGSERPGDDVSGPVELADQKPSRVCRLGLGFFVDTWSLTMGWLGFSPSPRIPAVTKLCCRRHYQARLRPCCSRGSKLLQLGFRWFVQLSLPFIPHPLSAVNVPLYPATPPAHPCRSWVV